VVGRFVITASLTRRKRRRANSSPRLPVSNKHLTFCYDAGKSASWRLPRSSRSRRSGDDEPAGCGKPGQSSWWAPDSQRLRATRCVWMRSQV
jgi:hypothetical protein